MNQFTKGGWRCDKWPVTGEYIIGTQEYAIATVHHVGDIGTSANAKLIAAAPDLYEALQLCALVLSGDSMNKGSLIRALELSAAALSKVTA